MKKQFEFQKEAVVLILPNRKHPDGQKTVKIPRNPVKAIRLHCLDCVGGYIAEVERCEVKCPLNPFRFGSNPFYNRTMTPEQMENAKKRMENARAKGNSAKFTNQGD